MNNASRGCGACPIGAPEARRDFIRDSVAAVVALGALAPSAWGAGSRTDKAYPIPAGDGVAIDKAESVIVARFENRVYAFSLACPHQNTALRWDKGAGRFQCPKHKSRYTPDGAFIDGRATRGLDRFAVRREGDQLMVNLDALYEEGMHAAEWKAAFIQL